MNIELRNLLPRLFIPLTVVGISLSIILFYHSNELIEAQNRINTQALNTTLFLAQHNLIMTTFESLPLPVDFLRSSYVHYSLAAYGITPKTGELESITTKSEYLEKIRGNQESIMGRVNIMKDTLTQDKNTLTKSYQIVFIILLISQFSLTLISWFRNEN